MHGTAHWMAFSTFYTGGTVVISPDHHLAPDRLWQLIADEQVSFLVIVGDAFARPLVEALERGGNDRWDLSGLSVILSGGAILSPSVKAALVHLLPSTLLVDGYGASETGGQGQMIAGAADASHPRFYVTDDTKTLDDLAEHSRALVAGYKVPRRLVLVEQVVRSPSGKPDYRWARAQVTAIGEDVVQ